MTKIIYELDDIEFLRYKEKPPKIIAYQVNVRSFKFFNGEKIISVEPGDYIIKDDNGIIAVMYREDFEEIFERDHQ